MDGEHCAQVCGGIKFKTYHNAHGTQQLKLFDVRTNETVQAVWR